MKINPYIKQKFNSTQAVMFDVIVALFPLVIMAWIAFGQKALVLIGTSVGISLLTDFIFSYVFLKKKTTVFDGSAIITGLLFSFTISPSLPWYVVAFGAFCAIFFGKIIWGGLGKNRFNPALIGREFTSVFFASVMTSPSIWQTKSLVHTTATNLFPGIEYPYLVSFLNGIIYKTSGALGEYSILFIVLGGLYLIFRKRISWHIPLALLLVFSLMFWLVEDGDDLKFSIAGVLLGTIYMATDMPSSPTTPQGKLYYGAMIGLVAFIFITGNVRFEYMSYSILLLNGFSHKINYVFQPRVWGTSLDWKQKIEQVFFLTLTVLTATLAVISLYYYDMIHYLIYIYIIYIIFKFINSYSKKINNPI